MIFLRKMKTKCAVKGCKSTGNKVDTYCVSVSREFGKGVVMCEKCIEEAYEALIQKKAAEAADEEKEAIAAFEAIEETAGEADEAEEAGETKKTTKKRKKAVEK